jgi:hypothetical protein
MIPPWIEELVGFLEGAAIKRSLDLQNGDNDTFRDEAIQFITNAVESNTLPKGAPRWIAVSERLPGKECWALCLGTGGEICAMAWWPTKGCTEEAFKHPENFQWNDLATPRGYSNLAPEDVTHWMPLPEPPHAQ